MSRASNLKRKHRRKAGKAQKPNAVKDAVVLSKDRPDLMRWLTTTLTGGVTPEEEH